jgi:hypothetical protein
MPKACCQSVADFRQTNTRLSVGPPVGRRLVDNRLPVGQRLTCPPQSAIRPPTVTGRSRVGQRFTFGMLSVISPACRDRCGLCQPAPAVRVSRRCPMYPSRPTGARRRTVSPSRAGGSVPPGMDAASRGRFSTGNVDSVSQSVDSVSQPAILPAAKSGTWRVTPWTLSAIQ